MSPDAAAWRAVAEAEHDRVEGESSPEPWRPAVAAWDELGRPYAVDMPAEKGPTKRHEMYSLFIDAQKASVTVNGAPLRGKVVSRNFADTKKSTAFLAFSESWMRTDT